ncbi:hypothetical protein UFOVP75_53 [uncultured Caudovirales phage]|uniref:Uncharacterized protein n=1 Tax=uncultured Caudovirales phage TaxID=2100421 RepID=A0A6J5L523_9CAUD|nr:hypothetical protein UFOVP75_53 [uncultured Caudovirales phage]
METSKSFSISVIGERTQEKWFGEFTAKTLISHRDELRRDAIRRELLGGTNPQFADVRQKNQAELFAEMSIRITKAPSWWMESNGGMDMYDDNVIAEVYAECLKAEQVALKAIQDAGAKAQADLKANAG